MSTPKYSLEERVLEKQERLQKMLEKAKQYEAQLKMLEAKKKEQERKDRAHRLIEVGGAVESVLEHPIEKEDIPQLIFFLQDLENQGHLFSKAMGIEPKEMAMQKTDFFDERAVES